MVPSAKHYNPPLLPFEKQIIELTGCTEEEYRYLVAEAIRRSGPRPAGYEHIPEITMGPVLVPILINLAIGIAVSAVSYLLMPKPKAGGGGDPATQRQLGSINGATRFSPTFGFDTQAELANYGDPIPIIFGRSTSTTGGIVVSPSLVWSRMFSYGNQQGVKLLMVVGEQGYDGGQAEQGIAPPAIQGIFLGNGALNSIFQNLFAFYWKRNTTSSGYTRIRAQNLLYGTRGFRQTGDPDTADDVFSCPTRASDNDYGFSSAHTPTNNAEFGCYDPIPNGTAYRVNWRVVSILELPGQEDDPGNNLLYERIKIAGDNDGVGKIRSLGMSGTGRNYSRRMGVTQLNGVEVSPSDLAVEREVNVGDIITFTIAADKIPSDFYSRGKVKVDDINSEITEQCYAADEALQVGELFMIGRTVWQVTQRSLTAWKENKEDQLIQLKCIEVPLGEYNKIGLVSRPVLRKNYIADTIDTANGIFPGVAFYPLMRFAVATIRNTRSCDVTEIGLRSSVFQRLNGLCNFQSLPKPNELIEAEGKRINLTSGAINSYVRRSSSFTVFVRPSGLDPSGNPYEWVHMGGRFTVVGNTPREAYNYLRIKHPDRRQYEFRIVPKNGADMRITPDTSKFWVLNASGSTSEILAESHSTQYGVFEVRSSGYIAYCSQLASNNEFKGKTGETITGVVKGFPESVGIQLYLPEQMAPVVKATAIFYTDVWSNPSGFTVGRSHAFAWQLFGGAGVSTLPVGGEIVREAREYDDQNRWMDIRYKAVKTTLPAGHYSARLYTWQFTSFELLQSSTGWNREEYMVLKRTLSSDNPFRVVPNQGTMNEAGVVVTVASVSIESGLQGRTQAWLEELLGPARYRSIGTKRTATIDLTKNSKRLRVALDTAVEYVPDHWSGVTSLWAQPTVRVIEDDAYTTKDWNQQDTVDTTVNVSSGNRFWKSTLPVGARFEIYNVSQQSVVLRETEDERVFESQSQYADLSFYGDLVEKSNKSNPEHQVVYVNEMVENQTPPTYSNMTICGLALKASRNFTSLDQLRLWLSSGIHVRRFHPDDAGAPIGPSNLLTDLVFYLLTDTVAGVGSVLGMDANNPVLIDTNSLVQTAKFLKTNSLFYDGVVSSSTNLRQFISDTAPFFLCNFIIKDGRFGLMPALPTTSSGEISTAPVQIKQLFTAGNIIEDSFEVEYLPAEERKDFHAIVRYREQRVNQLPQERNVAVRWATSEDSASFESFDMTAYCTSRNHAVLVARFLLSVRRRVTHTVKFSTTPYGIALAPGDFIRVATQSSPYSAANNGTITEAGDIISATTLSNGQYPMLYYKIGDADLKEGTLTVSNGKSVDPTFAGTVFTVLQSTSSENVYMVEQLTLNEDNTVQITASEFPCDSRLSSLIAQDVLNPARFLSES